MLSQVVSKLLTRPAIRHIAEPVVVVWDGVPSDRIRIVREVFVGTNAGWSWNGSP